MVTKGLCLVKIIKDCIYGHIRIPELCVQFMDVPEFQRLRRVRQLGMAHYVYPSAVHTRFEHSLGVMHLAGKMVDQLRRTAPIPKRTKHLVQLAGLYHDIGHFAYSHLFDMFLEKTVIDDNVDEVFKLKHHEDRSIYFLRRVNSRLSLLTETEQKFVEDAIRGVNPDNHSAYLYQIVCNSECATDVDKMDYLRRDSVTTGFPGFQSDYIILGALVGNDGRIVFKEKVRNDIRDLFATRQRMFENVYQHRATLKVGKIYFCIMKRLGARLFQYGDQTDDYNIETMMRHHVPELVDCLDNRHLNHACDQYEEYSLTRSIKQSGSVELVPFV